jgi:hypothetical protein
VCGVSPSLKRNSSTRRDLPMPGSPTTSASWPSPLSARSQRGARGRAPPCARRAG